MVFSPKKPCPAILEDRVFMGAMADFCSLVLFLRSLQGFESNTIACILDLANGITDHFLQ
jgi:hypothetical protein